jgi:hypothetical protein
VIQGDASLRLNQSPRGEFPYSGLVAATQSAQRQATFRWSSGTRSSTSAGITTLSHQHGVSESPAQLLAQAFGLPHSGQDASALMGAV